MIRLAGPDVTPVLKLDLRVARNVSRARKTKSEWLKNWGSSGQWLAWPNWIPVKIQVTGWMATFLCKKICCYEGAQASIIC